MTPNDPGLIFHLITFVEGVKLLHIHKLHVNATYSEGRDAFFGENNHIDPTDHITTPDPTIFCASVVVKVPVILIKFNDNQSS